MNKNSVFVLFYFLLLLDCITVFTKSLDELVIVNVWTTFIQIGKSLSVYSTMVLFYSINPFKVLGWNYIHKQFTGLIKCVENNNWDILKLDKLWGILAKLH